MASLNVLLIDDSLQIRQRTRELLVSKWPGPLKLREATTGAEALRILEEEEKPEVILLDLKLPDCNGFEVLKEIMRSESFPPVLVITTETGRAWPGACRERGAQGFIWKMRLSGELILALQRVLAGGTWFPDR